MSDKRLFIVSNRLPITVVEEGDEVQVKASSGGLITAIDSYLHNSQNQFSEILWAGVPGCSSATWKTLQNLPPSNYTYLPVLLNKEEYEKYYNGFSNSVLWPLFHYFPSYAEYDPDCYKNYIRANENFAKVLLRQLRAGDVVWIHDYHLLPLAQLLRTAIPALTIGFFLHIPFPSFELFRLLPKQWQKDILKGMLGADLIGFHTIDYATHFLQSVQIILGLDNDRNIIRYNDRLIKADVFPISIDFTLFNEAYTNSDITSLRESMQFKMKGRKIIFSVDRLDYSKGVYNRLKAYEYFLQQNPVYHAKVVFIIVIVPSRDTILKYAERKRMIDETISRINSQIGDIQWQPVIYQYTSLDFNDMMALNTTCHLALITPLRDGMNLVAKEFVASRKDKKGVLVLSEMAGAARELTDALLINPNDILEMAQKIKEGLEMDVNEQAIRLENMQIRIASYDVKAWANDYMISLKDIKQKQQSFQEIFLDEFAKRKILDACRNATKRLFLLDYDGTLVSFTADPDLAVPGTKLLALLAQLGERDENDVYLISGRNSGWLQKHFGALPINLIAEHGAKCKWKGDQWITEVQTHSEWKEQVHPLMEMYVRRCAHTFVEEKEFSLVWHYRNANEEIGKQRALELAGELNDYIHNSNLQVIMGNKIVEIRNSGIDKGTAIKKVLLKENYDFIFAVGDDRTDEDMFKTLSQVKNCFTIKVGPHASYAHYNLFTPQMVVSLLEDIKHFSFAPVIKNR